MMDIIFLRGGAVVDAEVLVFFWFVKIVLT